MKLRLRRIVMSILGLAILVFVILQAVPPDVVPINNPAIVTGDKELASIALEKLEVKGRAPKTNYSRAQFGGGWASINGCDTRNIILYRDLQNPVLEEGCKVVSGALNDPYTGRVIQFSSSDASGIQIDHVVALSDAWQKGAQLLTKEVRTKLANDPLELIAAEGDANQQKGDGDAATWLPSNKAFRCQYVARQIAIKLKYTLWVTDSEKQKMSQILSSCPNEGVPIR